MEIDKIVEDFWIDYCDLDIDQREINTISIELFLKAKNVIKALQEENERLKNIIRDFLYE